MQMLRRCLALQCMIFITTALLVAQLVFRTDRCRQTMQYLSPAKRTGVFKHSVMINFNYACPAIQRGQRSGFLSEGPLDSLFVWASSGGSGETARMRRLAWTFAARIGDKYQIHLTRSICDDQTAPEEAVLTGSSLFAILSDSLYNHIAQTLR